MKRIVLASANRGKLQELQSLLSPFAFEIVPQSAFDLASVEETGLTFVENAILKARYAAEKTHLPSLSDDSGLVVPALQGAPGIYSARYAGINALDAENTQKLLNAAKPLQGDERRAYYVCVIVLMQHAQDPLPVIATGLWHGVLLDAPRGNKGFGYDPIFYLPALGKTAAELESAEKNAISHRGKAFEALRRLLKEKESL